MAEELHAPEVVVHALNNVGVAELQLGRGRANLEQSLKLALAYKMHEHVARAYLNLAARDSSGCATILPPIDATWTDGIAYAIDHDVDSLGFYMRGWRAQLAVEHGRWSDAADEASEVLTAISWRLADHSCPALARPLLCPSSSRGSRRPARFLDEARDLVMTTGEVGRIAAVAAARAEAAWLDGDSSRSHRGSADRVRSHGSRRQDPKLDWRGEFLDVAGRRSPRSDCRNPEPFAFQIAGDWRRAAEAWERFGCPIRAGNGAGRRRRGGAARRARHSRATRRRPDGRHRPAGPSDQGVAWNLARSESRNEAQPRGSHRSGELEVLVLVAKGLQNTEIANRLFVSSKDRGSSCLSDPLEAQRANARRGRRGSVPARRRGQRPDS